jgi:hypothetical protein
MPRVMGNVPNLVNGVSQQTPAMRLPSQVERCDNFYPTVVDSLTKRPPTEFMAQLANTYPNSFTHLIVRDETEKYILVIEENGTPRVFDFQGNAKTLTNSSGSYLTTGITNAQEDIRALTVADYTFIVNRKKTVAVGNTYSAAGYPGQALVNVLAGNYMKTYRIRINDVVVAEYQTPDGDVASEGAFVDTSYIAAELVTDLVAAGYNTAPWAIARYGDAIYIQNSSTDFSISVEDGYGGRAMKAVKGIVQKFSDLPQNGHAAVVIKVTGSEGEAQGDYYVKFERNNVDNYTGVWKESTGKNVRLGLDKTTMPHKLVRNGDGTFTLAPVDWDGRIAGDVDSNPDPSFVGQTISDIFFHKNRLGMLTGESAVLSESGSFWNFYRTSMITLLDTDPIDIAASHVKVSILEHALPFNSMLLVFSDVTQFALKGNDLLTPKTAYMDPLTELSAKPTIRPVVCGTSVYFVSERESYASLAEYFVDRTFENADYEDVSGHAPTFVPAGIRDMAASPDLNLVVIVSNSDPDALYLYRFLWNGKEKIQSAWTRWILPGAEILNIQFDKNDLLVLVRRDGRIRLEKINCEQGSLEDIYLDNRYRLTSGTYDAGTNRTTFTTPFIVPADFAEMKFTVVTDAAPPGGLPRGVELTPVRISQTTFYVSGNHAAQPIYVGQKYESRFRFSEQFYRDQERAAVQAGRLQLLTMDLNYARSAYFRVEVTPQGRAMNTYPFTGRVISDGDNITGQIVTDSGRFSFPVMSRSDRVIIEVVSDGWLPCSFTSAKWMGIFNPHTRQQ